jgi:hypothetical protein
MRRWYLPVTPLASPWFHRLVPCRSRRLPSAVCAPVHTVSEAAELQCVVVVRPDCKHGDPRRSNALSPIESRANWGRVDQGRTGSSLGRSQSAAGAAGFPIRSHAGAAGGILRAGSSTVVKGRLWDIGGRADAPPAMIVANAAKQSGSGASRRKVRATIGCRR